jgi:polysaccharide deacetylase 2 family uncharacterized protein YibQ
MKEIAVADDLDTPLKALVKNSSKRRLPVSPPTLLTVALAGALGFAMLWILIYDDPLGGEPRHVVKIDPIAVPQNAKTKTAPDAKTQQTKETPAAPGPDQRTITIIDGNTGAKRNVVVNNPGPDAAPANQNQPAQNIPVDKRLIEQTKHGSIPKIAPDGVRPLDVYASPVPVAANASDSMIAIVIVGLGVSSSGTADAIAKLPAAVTLAFVPYGGELPRWIARARGTGHEVLLQVPMEPLDYPDNDPGPQTLIANAPKDQTIDRLHYFLSRSQGYVGITNLMGARFTANEDALSAIIAETGKRGLLFLDDGSSPRSQAQQAATKSKAPFLKADLALDARADWSGIDAALVKLEAIAAEKGVAIATANALPVTIERIARWAKTLEARGIRLVPVSAAFQRKGKQS